MVRSTSSPTLPSCSSSSSASTATNWNIQKDGQTKNNNNISAKCLVEQIPLVAPPPLNCKNLSLLENTQFVNVVFEKDLDFFRVSDHNNQEVCRLMRHHEAESQPQKKGVKYLECRDTLGNCLLYVAYPVGLGEMAILSPTEELMGECLSNVDFICLSVKVKYNYYDVNGHRVMKMTGILPEDGSKDKFMLMVKRNKKEKLALIKMGMLKSCCNIKFKTGHVSVMERLQILALWAGFMHNELQDTEIAALLEKHEQVKKEKEESRSRKKSLIFRKAITTTTSANLNEDDDSESSPDKVNNSQAIPQANAQREASSTVASSTNKNINHRNNNDSSISSSIAKVKLWKNLVTAHFSGQQQHNEVNTNHQQHYQNQKSSNYNNNYVKDQDNNNVHKNKESQYQINMVTPIATAL